MEEEAEPIEYIIDSNDDDEDEWTDEEDEMKPKQPSWIERLLKQFKEEYEEGNGYSEVYVIPEQDRVVMRKKVWIEPSAPGQPRQLEWTNRPILTEIHFPWRQDFNNVCFAGDLVITFPMQEDQIKQCTQRRDTYRLASIKAHSLLKQQVETTIVASSSDSKVVKLPADRPSSYDSKANKKTMDLLVESGLLQGLTSDTEKKQVYRSQHIFLPAKVLPTYHMDDEKYFASSLSMGHLIPMINQFQDNLNQQDNLIGYSSMDLSNIKQLDKTGKGFNFIRQYIRTNEEPFFIASTNRESRSFSKSGDNINYETILGRYDREGRLHMIQISKSDNRMFSVMNSVRVVQKVLATVETRKEEVFQYKSDELSIQGFLDIFKQYTNRDYLQWHDKTFEPLSPEYYASLKYYSPIPFNIPSLKDIAFSVLKEKYLISRKETIESILLLPQILIQEFIKSCVNDFKPVGFEILQDLKKELESSSSSSSLVDELIPLDYWIKSMFKRDDTLRRFYVNHCAQSIFHPMFNEDNLLINVYQSFDQFKRKDLPMDRVFFASPDSISPVSSSKAVGQPSIVNHATFLENFHKNTNNIFNKPEMDWSNIIIIGGIVTASLIGSTLGFEESDIDICFYGSNFGPQDYKDRIDRLIACIGEQDNLSICSTRNCLTLSKHHPNRHIQINDCLFVDVEHVLLGVDIEASCFAFDGKNVWTMQRGVEAINYRCNFASPFGHSIRGNMYQRRLLKYLLRGFSIAHFTDDPIIIERFGTTPNNNNNNNNHDDQVPTKEYYQHHCQNGIALLYSARDNPAIFAKLVAKNKSSSLPYGPKWDKERFDMFVQDSFDENYDGYNDDKYPQLIDLDDLSSSRLIHFDNVEDVQLEANWNTPLDQDDIYDDDEDEDEDYDGEDEDFDGQDDEDNDQSNNIDDDDVDQDDMDQDDLDQDDMDQDNDDQDDD
ncbi:hypothetical protein DFA_06778 [Cavenderia fasciculata]|uniref:Uncharacterized protein n=1 Tax=Cavenderia fasciculata TaxID=261658 RepID=F4Q291_CACFS|nr:uncharacterized protein DFA_06778 [Cavenderia fasciculata]EGG18111.1 hypothetical protein DFA_06778 [Cavenderia fasciculata]|eukprot:XP_004366152.1 hypothetical protein DFA_06778 [Cavenderia fasciculata]